MDKDKLRIDKPVLPQIKKPQSTITTATKRRAAPILNSLRKEFAPDTLKGSQYNPQDFIKLKNDTEKYEIFKKRTADSIAKARVESVRFNNFKKRSIASSVNKILGYSKTCTLCGIERGTGAFDKNFGVTNSSKVRRSYCYMCRKKMNKKYWAKRKERLENDSM
jgi:hypothetical protein